MSVIALVASAARTTTGTSSGVNSPGGQDECSVLVAVTAVSGTSPSATFTVEWSNDGTAWAKADPEDAFTAITAAANRVKTFKIRGEYLRLAWAITGTTPSFTFSADVNASDFD